MRKMILAASAAFAVMSTAAVAAVSVNENGVGFVGKGDVQLAFGWNNAALQKNAGGVTFSYESSAEYSAVCTWVTGEGTRGERTHNVTHKRKTSISAIVAYDARNRNQITGFNLNGFSGLPTETGTVPVVDGPCMGNEGHGGTWSSVTQVGETTGGLFVNYGGTSVAMPNTPTI